MKALVLLSGGLDSAKAVAEFYGVAHYELNLSPIFALSNCPLIARSNRTIEHTSYAEQVKSGRVSTYVPFRNGLMLSAAASFAGSLFEDDLVEIYIGAHADDAAGNAYADCREDFVQALSEAIKIGTYEKIRPVAPFIGKSKADVVKIGLELGTPYKLTWSCYEGGKVPCGKCATCIDRARAFELNGVADPAEA